MHFGAAESGVRRGARVGLGPACRRETCSLGADFSEQADTEDRAAREAHQDRCVRVVLECLVSAVFNAATLCAVASALASGAAVYWERRRSASSVGTWRDSDGVKQDRRRIPALGGPWRPPPLLVDEDDRSVGWRRRGDKAIVDESATRTAIAEVTADCTPHRHLDHRKPGRTFTGGVISCTNFPTVDAHRADPERRSTGRCQTGGLVRPVGRRRRVSAVCNQQ